MVYLFLAKMVSEKTGILTPNSSETQMFVFALRDSRFFCLGRGVVHPGPRSGLIFLFPQIIFLGWEEDMS